MCTKILQSEWPPWGRGGESRTHIWAEKVGLIFGLILQQEKVELILQPQRTGRNNEIFLIYSFAQRTGRNNEIFLIYSFAQRTGRTGRSECPSDNV